MPAPASTPSRGLTPKFVESLQPAPARYYVADRRAPGLRLQVLPKGRKVFRWVCNARGRVFTIGPWSLSEQPGRVTLAQARDWLERLKAAHAAGDDQLAQVEAELRAHLRRRAHVADSVEGEKDTFKAVAEEFYKRRIVPHRRRPEAVRDVLDNDLLPALGARPIGSLTARECAAVVERVVDRGAVVHAGKVLGTLKQALRWAQARGYTDRNPAAPLEPKDLGVEHPKRKRFLAEEEIPLFWRGLGDDRTEPRPDKNGKVQTRLGLSATTRAGLRLLLMTGVRTGELLAAEWSEVDFDAATWTIPVEHTKYTKDQAAEAKPFVVPLNAAALALFGELRRLNGKGRFVMGSDAADAGHVTEKALGRALRRLQGGAHPLLSLPGGRLSPHDLRRTMRTHLGKLRVPLHVVERSLNHFLGRIIETYDQGDYLDERREALEKWGGYVEHLVTGTGAEVVPLPASARAS